MKNRKALLASTFSFLSLILISLSLSGEALAADVGPPVRRGQRRTLTVSEYGKITAVNITDGQKSAPYHLQFFTLEPNSLFLPVLLHVDMVFYVHTGSGKLTYAEDDRVSSLDLRQGDVATLEAGCVFYLQSNLEPDRTKLRIHAIFANTDENNYDPLIGAYTSISELFLGFDKKIMQAAFEVPEDLIEAITNRTETPAIVHAVSNGKTNIWDFEAWFLNRVLGGEGGTASNKKKNKHRKYNIFDKGPDFQNCNGWSLTVAKKQLKSLKTTNMGLFMVNLNTGSMMGPHWNPRATVIAVVLQGQGMVVRVVCGNSGKPGCQNMRFKAREGDVFVVSRFHPMAQISFNNDSFVFMGFSTDTKKNYPQFLAGKTSVLQTVDRSVLAASFNVTNTTVDQILGSQNYSNLLGCVSCAEEEERKMIDEEERKKEKEEAREREEERKREEEAAREREEEKKREEEAAREREEEKKREEEEREREEARKREEDQRKREEEEARRREEQEREREEARKREEEEQRKREEEEARREEQEREREEARKREEMKREDEEEREGEDARKRKEIEREDEEAKRREEQEQAEREQREEEQEASCDSCEQEEAAARRKEEEERQRSQEEKRYRIIFEGRRALKMRSI